MASAANYGFFTKRIIVSLTAAVIFLACGPLTHAQGQCNPQELAKLIASDAAADDIFGISVAVSGDTAVVGAAQDDDAGSASGSAYVFVRSDGVWTQQAKLTASDAAANALFGWSVAVSGDMAVIGAQNDANTGVGSAGSAYVFVRQDASWMQQAKLTPSDLTGVSSFGNAVALFGGTALVGAYLSSNEWGPQAGSAYVFVRIGEVWTEQAKLDASDVYGSDQFGCSVALSDDMAVVGSAQDLHGGIPGSGSARVFVRTGSTWSQQTRLTASDTAASDLFGFSVALCGDTALVGAYEDDHPGVGFNAGSAYVFNLTDCDADDTPDVCEMDSDSDGLIDDCDGDIDGDSVPNASDDCPTTPVCMAADLSGRPRSDLNFDCNIDGLDIQPLVPRLY